MRFLFIVLLTLLWGCSYPPLEDREKALTLVKLDFELEDDLPLEELILGIEKNIDHLRRTDQSFINFSFGKRKIEKQDYLIALEDIIRFYKANQNKSLLLRYVKENFDFYQTYGHTKKGEILLTSYFEPVIKGASQFSPPYTQALYKRPSDIVEIQFANYLLGNHALEIKGPSLLYGRLIEKKSKRGNPQIAPYFSRKEIDGDKKLKNQNLELCYVDPLDAFFFQIQGSGSINLLNGEKMRLGYDGQNGHKYVAIGKHLTEHIPLEKMSLQSIMQYLKELTVVERDQVLFLNPSYVFFKPLMSRPITTLGTEVIDGRTIATDVRFFPKGALAFMYFDYPVFNSEQTEINGKKRVSRLVLDQDTGGAIKGGGRVDLFWGTGDKAKKYAGQLKSSGRLYYLAPKMNYLEKIK